MDSGSCTQYSRNPRETYTASVSKRNSAIDDYQIRNRTNSMTALAKQYPKKPFLKKGSRKFLASSIVEPLKVKSVNIIQQGSKSARDKISRLSKSRNDYQDKTLIQSKISESSSSNLRDSKQNTKSNVKSDSHNSHSHSNLNLNLNWQINSSLKQQSFKTMYVPPDLLLSRLKGKVKEVVDKNNTIRKIFDDGRIEITFKAEDVREEYLKDIALTQYKSGDFKLRWDGKTIEWIELHQCYQNDGQLIFSQEGKESNRQ